MGQSYGDCQKDFQLVNKNKQSMDSRHFSLVPEWSLTLLSSKDVDMFLVFSPSVVAGFQRASVWHKLETAALE